MEAGIAAATVPDIFARARERLSLDEPAGLHDPSVIPRHDDHDADPAVVHAIAAVRPIRPAAVLVGIVARAEPMVLFTQRTAHLKDHAGQISFPGGKIEPSDASPAAAALRETEEEIGLSRRLVEPLGYLDIHMTTRGYRIVPTLARVAPDFQLTLNHAEVDETFEVPLAFLMEPQNHKLDSRNWNGLTRTFYAMPFGNHYIWGATAGILRNLWARVWR